MDRLGSLSLHSLVPLVVWQVNSDTGDTGQSVLAVVAMLLAGALFIALCVALLFMAFRRIGKHQKSIVQELEKLGLGAHGQSGSCSCSLRGLGRRHLSGGCFQLQSRDAGGANWGVSLSATRIRAQDHAAPRPVVASRKPRHPRAVRSAFRGRGRRSRKNELAARVRPFASRDRPCPGFRGHLPGGNPRGSHRHHTPHHRQDGSARRGQGHQHLRGTGAALARRALPIDVGRERISSTSGK